MMKIAVPTVALLTINSHEALAAAKRVRGGGRNKAEVDYLAETISSSPSIYDHEAALLQLDNNKAKNKKKKQKKQQTRRGNNNQRRATSWSAASNPWLPPATAATNNADLILDNTTVKMSKYKGKKRGGHGKKHRSDKQRKTSSDSSSKSNKEAGWGPSSSTKSTWKSSSGGSSSSDSGSSSSKDEETIIVIGEKEESKSSSSSSGWSKDAWDKPSSWDSPSWSGSSTTPSPSSSGKPVNDGPKKMWWGGPNAGWQDSPWGQTVWKSSSSSAEETVINNWVNTGLTEIISGCSAFNTQTINGVLPPARPGEPPAPTPTRTTPQPPSMANSGPGGAPKIQQIQGPIPSPTIPSNFEEMNAFFDLPLDQQIESIQPPPPPSPGIANMENHSSGGSRSRSKDHSRHNSHDSRSKSWGSTSKDRSWGGSSTSNDRSWGSNTSKDKRSWGSSSSRDQHRTVVRQRRVLYVDEFGKPCPFTDQPAVWESASSSSSSSSSSSKDTWQSGSGPRDDGWNGKVWGGKDKKYKYDKWGGSSTKDRWQSGSKDSSSGSSSSSSGSSWDNDGWSGDEPSGTNDASMNVGSTTKGVGAGVGAAGMHVGTSIGGAAGIGEGSMLVGASFTGWNNGGWKKSSSSSGSSKSGSSSSGSSSGSSWKSTASRDDGRWGGASSSSKDKKTIVNNWVNTGETIIVTGGSQFNPQTFTNGAAGTISAPNGEVVARIEGPESIEEPESETLDAVNEPVESILLSGSTNNGEPIAQTPISAVQQPSLSSGNSRDHTIIRDFSNTGLVYTMSGGSMFNPQDISNFKKGESVASGAGTVETIELPEGQPEAIAPNNPPAAAIQDPAAIAGGQSPKIGKKKGTTEVHRFGNTGAVYLVTGKSEFFPQSIAKPKTQAPTGPTSSPTTQAPTTTSPTTMKPT